MGTTLPVLFISLLMAASGVAKRVAPSKVSPVKTPSAVYSAPHFIFEKGKAPISGGVVEARDPKSDKVLWRLQIYQTNHDKDLEGDVQDVFIKSLSYVEAHDILFVTDERKRLFVLDIKNRKVTRIR